MKKNVSETEIKKAFRKKALIIHPDKSRADTKDKFVELFEAYEILSDKKKRDRYDKLYSLFFTEATELKDEELRTDIKQILEKGQEYAGDFNKFNREVLVLILLELFFDPNYVLFASLASIFFWSLDNYQRTDTFKVGLFIDWSWVDNFRTDFSKN